MLDEIVSRAIDISFYLPLPLIVWAGFKWFHAVRSSDSPVRRRLTYASLVMVACSSLAFALLIGVLELFPPDNANTRVRLLIRGVQIGFVTGVLGVGLAPFSVKTMRVLLVCAGLLVSYHWYLLGNAY